MTKVKFGGKEWASLKELCRVFGRGYTTVYKRRKNGMSLKDALYTKHVRAQHFEFNGKDYTTQTLAQALQLDETTIQRRSRLGWGKDVILPNQGMRLITAWNRTQRLTEWARERKMNKHTLLYRLDVLNLPPEIALSLPLDQAQSRKVKSKKKEAS